MESKYLRIDLANGYYVDNRTPLNWSIRKMVEGKDKKGNVIERENTLSYSSDLVYVPKSLGEMLRREATTKSELKKVKSIIVKVAEMLKDEYNVECKYY